ncbi:MAG: glycosyltransferase [Cyclobacteriaceae bacterium]|nr:glycosyltransferase [Cyclobacteriaceae bacterium]
MSFFENKKILLVSPEPWDHIFVSKHHYAVHLAARGNQVFFVNPPGENWSISGTDYQGLSVVGYPGFIRGLRFLPSYMQKWFIKKAFQQMETFCQCQFDVFWSFDNSVFYDFSALPDRVTKISHIVDLNQDFQFEIASKTADICFCTSRYILHKQLACNSNSYFVHHGLHDPGSSPDDVHLPGNNAIKAMYVGNLAMPFLDWQILLQAVTENPEVDFIWVGPNKAMLELKKNPLHRYKKEIFERENVYFLDRIPSDRIPAYLISADVLLLAYQEIYHRDQVNPHKLMEYLGSGKPIVCSFSEEYESLSEIMVMSKKNKDWPVLFKKTIHNLAYWNEPDLQHQRKAYAMDHTYKRQLERIENFLKA